MKMGWKQNRPKVKRVSLPLSVHPGSRKMRFPVKIQNYQTNPFHKNPKLLSHNEPAKFLAPFIPKMNPFSELPPASGRV
jgi:hypothetical protein